MLKRLISAVALLAIGSTGASAHVTLEAREAAAGSYYKAVFRVPHGCQGKPTTALRVRIPEGLIAVKPQPKPGWTLEKIRDAYKKSYTHHGNAIGEGVREIIWSGGELGDDEYDEFVLRGFVATDLEAGSTLYFPTVQECPDGAVERWIEIPAPGGSSRDLKSPAPGIKLMEKAGGR